MDDVLDTYSEVHTSRRSHYTLYADRLIKVTKAGGYNSESAIRLSDLRPEPNRLWIRPGAFFLGVVFVILAIPLAVNGLYIQTMEKDPGDRPLFWYGWAAALVTVAIAIFSKTFGKVPTTQFVSQGGVPLLDVASVGPERNKHAEFVALLIKQIRMNQGPTHPGS